MNAPSELNEGPLCSVRRDQSSNRSRTVSFKKKPPGFATASSEANETRSEPVQAPPNVEESINTGKAWIIYTPRGK